MCRDKTGYAKIYVVELRLYRRLCDMEKLVMEFDINEMSVTDVSELCDLLSKGDIAFEMEKIDHAGDMGVDSSSLTVIISSVVATMPVLLAAYKVWVKNRKVEFTLKNDKAGKSVTYTSESGRFPTEEDMRYLLDYCNDAAENKGE